MYLYEFLFRGRSPDSAEPAAWHIRLAQDVDIPGGGGTHVGGALTPDQAAAAGFPLATVLAGINAEVLSQATAASEALAAKHAHASALESDLADTKRSEAEHKGRADSHAADIERLSRELAEARRGLTEASTDRDRLRLLLNSRKAHQAF